jgi:putative ABC transport system substrate-binding protein
VHRRAFLTALGGRVLAAPLAAEGQRAAKVPRIGFLGLNLAPNPDLHEAFRQGLCDLGYVEDRNVVIEYRDAEGKLERLPALAAELVALKSDVLVTGGGTPTALAAKQATKNLPIVFTSAPDPVTDGLVTSLAHPGGNVTGSANLAPELVRRVLKALGVTVTVDTTNKEATNMGGLAGVLPTKFGYASCTVPVGGRWISLWASAGTPRNFAH